MNRVKQDIIRIGRAMLDLDLQNSHSGNISVRKGGEMYITKTGAMKGHLRETDIVDPGLETPRYGIFQASSETGTHRRILEYAGAAIHAHSIPAILLSYLVDDFLPGDMLGRHEIGKIPVVRFEYPVGSREMEEEIPRILRDYPVMIIKTHGPVTRGRDLTETFYRLTVLDYSCTVELGIRRLGIAGREPSHTKIPPPGSGKKHSDWQECGDPELMQQFRIVTQNLFYRRLSPFHTGSISVRDGKDMLFCPRASVPDSFPISIYRIPLGQQYSGYFESLHQAVYRHSHCQAALFSHSPQAVIQGYWALREGSERLIPVDAEGGYLYPAIPLVSTDRETREIVQQAEAYKMVLIPGIGVLATGHTPTHCLHHNSSLKNICLIRNRMLEMEAVGMVEEVKKLEDERGENW